jgi:putative peptide zinc metalloprotease protein
VALGIELLGAYKDSGCVEPPWIIRRADGQMLEVSPLLHRLAASLDGERDLEAVASRLSQELGRPISVASVEYLIDTKLRPLGLVADSATADPLPSRQALLGLTLHAGVAPARLVRAVTTVLRPLFLPALIVGALAALVFVDVWLVLGGGIAPGVERLISEPALLLLAVALTLMAGGLHELGHATASRYGGAEPGVIGAGIYLIWPVFYNDLNDSHRLDRRGRLRCDLGGVYFNVVFILVLAGVYGVTGFEPLVVVLAVQHLAILQQFLPFVRLDGYYVVSDLAGIPDLFGRIRPILSSLVPGRSPAKAVTVLKPKARAIVTAWVLTTVPLLMASLLFIAIRLPSLVATTGRSIGDQSTALLAALRHGAVQGAALSGLQLVLLAVPVVGIAVTMARAVDRGRRTSVHRRLGRLILSFGAPRG